MANLLVLDDDTIAQKALAGILKDTLHQVWYFETNSSAWSFLESFSTIDLIVLEVRSSSGLHLDFLRRLRSHFIFNKIPLIVYSQCRDKGTIQEVLRLGVQNYLLKPYSEEIIAEEIDKAISLKWRENFLEDPSSVCSRLSLSEDEYYAMLGQLETKVTAGVNQLESIAQKQSLSECQNLLKEFSALSKASGCVALNQMVLDVDSATREDQWHRIPDRLPEYRVLPNLIATRAKPSYRPGNAVVGELRQGIDTAQHSIPADLWKQSNFEEMFPLLERNAVLDSAEKLKSFPVIDYLSASFQMAARTEEMDYPMVVDLVKKDPGLVIELLIRKGKFGKADGSSFEDPLTLIQSLGEDNIRRVSQSLATYSEKTLKSEYLKWQFYRVRQVARASLSQKIAGILGLNQLGAEAYWGALLYGMGRVLMFYLFPGHYINTLAYSRTKGISLRKVEALVFGVTHEDLGLAFAKKHKLPNLFQDCIAQCHDPQKSEQPLTVALVSLAEYLCKSCGITYTSNTLGPDSIYFRNHPSWLILQDYIPGSFSYVQFEKDIRKCLVEVKYSMITA